MEALTKTYAMYCLLHVCANVYACVRACAHVGASGHPPVLSVTHRPPCVSEVVFGLCWNLWIRPDWVCSDLQGCAWACSDLQGCACFCLSSAKITKE